MQLPAPSAENRCSGAFAFHCYARVVVEWQSSRKLSTLRRSSRRKREPHKLLAPASSPLNPETNGDRGICTPGRQKPIPHAPRPMFVSVVESSQCAIGENLNNVDIRVNKKADRLINKQTFALSFPLIVLAKVRATPEDKAPGWFGDGGQSLVPAKAGSVNARIRAVEITDARAPTESEQPGSGFAHDTFRENRSPVFGNDAIRPAPEGLPCPEMEEPTTGLFFLLPVMSAGRSNSWSRVSCFSAALHEPQGGRASL